MIRPTPRKAPPMPRRLLSAAAACTLLLGLAACGEGGDGPVTTPPPSIDISGQSDGGGDDGAASDGGGDDASPNAAPAVPAPDPADYPGMDENTPEGAEQAFRYYMALMIWGYQTGSVDELDARSAEGCNTCSHNSEIIVKNAANGLFWSPTVLEDVGLKNYPSADYDYEIGYVFYIGAHAEPEGNGGGMREEPRTEYTAVGVMRWVDAGWEVVAIELEQTGEPIDA